jgi:hypothetical protein
MVSDFIMHGAREAVAGGLPHIEEHVKGIERAVVENAGLAFDLAKTLIESVCKTILTERNISFDQTDDLPKLFRKVTGCLPILPASASQEVEARRSLAQTLNGLHTAVQGVCELRNACGFASHGADQPRPVMENVQAVLAAQAADTIIGFLYGVHCQQYSASRARPPEYDDNPNFNAYVDETNDPVRIFSLEYLPSEVLFYVDEQAYRDALADYAKDESSPGGGVTRAPTPESQE